MSDRSYGPENDRIFAYLLSAVVFVLIVLTSGEPDILDALIYWITDGTMGG